MAARGCENDLNEIKLKKTSDDEEEKAQRGKMTINVKGEDSDVKISTAARSI